MVNKTLTILSFSIILALMINSGCKKSGTETESYIIQIDSLVHADTINFGDNLTLKFYGVIGENGCYSFDKFEPEYTTGNLSITTWGLYTKQDMCTEELPYLNGEPIIITDIPAGTITIIAVQAEGPNISQEVFVKQ